MWIRLSFVRRSPLPAAVSTLLVLVAVGCRGGDDAPPTDSDRPSSPVLVEWFVDLTETTGLDFTHFNGMTGKFYYPEVMGPGVGLFDYDNDGDLDVYITQGDTLDGGEPTAPSESAPTDRLFRNDLAVGRDGSRLVTFVDVTEQAGIDTRGYGQGVATGDIDNDGWVDVYLPRLGPNQLFRNRGDGTFEEVSDRTGTADPGWGVSAAFFDFDRDGSLDLFVGNYLNYSVETHVPCFNRTGPPDYCGPEIYRPQPDRLYRNRGDGTFDDVTVSSGMARAFGPRSAPRPPTSTVTGGSISSSQTTSRTTSSG